MLKVMITRLLGPLLMLIAMAIAGLPVLLAGSPVAAADAVAAAKASSGWLQIPKPAKGKGDKCVADTEYMRRNHMNLLLHQRDDTVHDGIRTKRFSLNECISCHAVTEKGAARPVTIKSPKHFCRTCHDYVAVRVDCFQCHASRPDAGSKPGKAAFLWQSGLPGPGPGPGTGSSGGAPSGGKNGKGHAIGHRANTAALANYVRSAQQ